MELKMEIYTPGLELLGILEQYRSLIFEEKAFSAGSFSLDALITDEALALLAPENIVWIAGDTAGIIEYVQQQTGEDGPYIAVKGRLLAGILDRRILWGTYDLCGTAPEIMHQLVGDCAVHPTRGDAAARKIPGLTLLSPPAGGESIRGQRTGGSLLDALEEIAEANGVAFGVRLNPAVPCMEFWTRRGVRRSVGQSQAEPVFYSTEMDDVLSSEYSYDSTGCRNVALVAGEGEGKDRVTVTVTGGTEGEKTAFSGFVPADSTLVMLTSDGRELSVRAADAGGAAPYKSAYTGSEIDRAVSLALAGSGAPNAGVSSFHGRTGAVVPQSGDYTAAMVGAATMAQVDAAIQSAILQSWEASY